MKICIPTRDPRGMASRVNEHFANAPYFTICDTASGELQVVPGDRHSGHAHRTHHVHLMKSHDVDAVAESGLETPADCARVARYTRHDVNRLLSDAGIVRNRLKTTRLDKMIDMRQHRFPITTVDHTK